MDEERLPWRTLADRTLAEPMMGQLNQWANDLLWRGYDVAPQPLLDLAGKARRVLSPLAELRCPLNWLTGVTPAGRHVRVLVAGKGMSNEYLTRRIFARPPTARPAGSAWLAALPRMLRQMRRDADITIAEVDRVASRFLFHDDYLHVPGWVLATLPVPRNLEAITERNKSVHSDVKLVKRNGLQSEHHRSPQDLDRFYHEMYLPFARERHGAGAIVRPLATMRRAFREGGILWIRQEEQIIAGMLYRLHRGVLHLISLGTRGGDYSPAKSGALAAIYLYGIQLAMTHRCTLIDFGGTRPCARDGVLLFKKKWGIRFQPKPDCRRDLLVRWEKPGPLADEFLTHSPLLFRAGAAMGLVTAVEGVTPERARDLIHVEGVGQTFVMGQPTASSKPLSPALHCSDPLHHLATPIVENPAATDRKRSMLKNRGTRRHAFSAAQEGAPQ